MDEEVIRESERLVRKFGSRAIEASEELMKVDYENRYFYQDVKRQILLIEEENHKKFVGNLWKTHNK